MRIPTLPLLLVIAVTASANARDYYLSSSIANASDSNPGTMDAPMQNLTHIKDLGALAPGDRVLLKRGDIWTNQTLELSGKGTATQPIVVATWSTGNRPIIQMSTTFDSKCVVVQDPSYVAVRDLDCRDAYLGIYLRYMDDYNNQSVLVSNCVFTHINATGRSVIDGSTTEYAYATGVWLGGKANDTDTVITSLTIENCAFNDSVEGFGTCFYFPSFAKRDRIKGLTIRNCTGNNNLKTLRINYVTGGTCDDVTITNNGGAINTGIAAVMIQYSNDFTFNRLMVDTVTRTGTSPDGVGLDLESDTQGIGLKSSTIKTCDGAAVMIFQPGSPGRGPNTDVAIEDCTFINNVINPDTTHNTNYDLYVTNSGHSGHIWTSKIYSNQHTNPENKGFFGQIVNGTNLWWSKIQTDAATAQSRLRYPEDL